MTIAGLVSALNHFFAFARRGYRTLLLLVLADATLHILFSTLTDLILDSSGYDGGFSWLLTVILWGKSFFWTAILLCVCISAVRGATVIFPKQPVRAYAATLVRFAVVYYPAAYLLTFASQYLAPRLPHGGVSFCLQSWAFKLLMVYPLLRLGPWIVALLAGDAIRFGQAWRMTEGRFVAFMLPLVPLTLGEALLSWFALGIPSALQASMTALRTVFWFSYCAVWYVEIVDRPDPDRTARING